ncbi:uncharacterized protein PAN0_007c3253 [Moesziomyces antarcticus]|uniref:Pheromone receptor n=1 Tax=Pseudozyma antarctica TaxID=84753 RepID=A0A081CEE0_PSEA2|nr:uncharacterized protein PAN0_007c3253 [Moesziomyces antarcticus]GAK65036.1 hypothetical protein PAN0_007c3253 [Moesziomyces antarcticus]
MSALFFAGVRFGSLRTAVPVPSRTSTSFKLLSPLSSNTYRTIAFRGQVLLTRAPKLEKTNHGLIERQEWTAIRPRQTFPKMDRACDMAKKLVGASLYSGRKLIYNAAVSQNFPNWTSKKRGKIGGLTESEFHSKVENGDRLTRATCTFRRIAKAYQKQSGLKDLRGTFLTVKWITYGTSHILEVEDSPFPGRRKDSNTMFSIAENNTYAAFCLIAACLSTLSVPVHVRAGNTAVLLMIFWCSLGLVNKGVNTLAFNHKLRVTWMFACDISAIIERTWQLGLCCGSLCVLHRLENIASLRQAHSTETDRRRRFWIDVGIGLGIPFLQIPLFFIVQPNRLDVQEDIGCSAPLYNSVPALFAYYLWRLLASVFSLALSGLRPYPGWKQFHAQFNTINFIPMIRDGSMRALFVFFGLTDEAKSIYGFFWSFVKGGRRSAHRFKKSSSPLRDHRSLTNGTELDLEDFQRSTDKISVALHKDVLVS